MDHSGLTDMGAPLCNRNSDSWIKEFVVSYRNRIRSYLAPQISRFTKLASRILNSNVFLTCKLERIFANNDHHIAQTMAKSRSMIIRHCGGADAFPLD